MDSILKAIDLLEANIPQIAKVDRDWAQAYRRAIDNYRTGQEMNELPNLIQLLRYPVSVEEFMFGGMYLGKQRKEIYPEVLRELEAINNPDGYRVINKYDEGVFTGGIGSAKSTTALYTVAYQLYVLSCFADPHSAFNMDSSSEIVIVFQSINGGLAKDVDYDRFYAMVKNSPYFTTIFPYNKQVTTELHFPNRVQVKPISTDTGTIGQNVIGGLLDELNFMAITPNSKKASDGGTYDQASVIYNGLSRRRKSRFSRFGNTPGILCLVSSKRYPGEFTDRKMAEAKTDPSIYVYDKCVWDIKPQGTYSKGWFNIFIGDIARKPRIMRKDEVLDSLDSHLIKAIPEEYRADFENDITGSMRDIAGVSLYSKNPFFSNAGLVTGCFGKTRSILNLEETDFTESLMVYLNRIEDDRKNPRWVHIDLGVTSDSAGVACGYVSKFRMTADGIMMPEVTIDFLLRVRPPRNEEIKFYKIRELLIKLRSMGLPIKWISFDSFQSVDSIQLLKQQGFAAGMVSMDRNTLPYHVTKTCVHNELLRAPIHQKCEEELHTLEYIAALGKIDHPPRGSKDVADALAGVVHGLTTRRDIWAMYSVPINKLVESQKEANITTN